MIWNITVHIGDDDILASPPRNGEIPLEITIDRKTEENVVAYNVKQMLRAASLVPQTVAVDLLHLALSIFSADRAVSRDRAYNRWERGFRILIPVSNLDLWQSVQPQLEEILNFLTNDHWIFEFRQLNGEQSPSSVAQMPKSHYSNVNTIALLSGGLDSFVGAIDALEHSSVPVAFMSHHNAGSVVNKVQDHVIESLALHYRERLLPFRFYVQPPKILADEGELTSRSRSFLFISLAVIVASAFGSQTRIIVPENGYMSLNIPLAPNRLGSLSTRTTHPYFLSLFQELLMRLNIPVLIDNPYRFMTKGEMLANSSNRAVLQEGIKHTHSCSNAAHHRFEGVSPYTHCGYCLPCLIRRAATHYANVEDVAYHVDVLTTPFGEDLPALRRAILRVMESETPLIFDTQKNGRVPDSQSAYADVYRRGLMEVASFLRLPARMQHDSPN